MKMATNVASSCTKMSLPHSPCQEELILATDTLLGACAKPQDVGWEKRVQGPRRKGRRNPSQVAQTPGLR